MSATQFGYFTDHYYFSKYLKDKFQVDFLCIDSYKPKIEEVEVNVIYIENKRKLIRLFQFLITAIKKANNNNYDVMIVSYYKLVYLIGIFSNVPVKILDVCTGDLHDNSILRSYKNSLILFSTFFFFQG